MSRNRFLSVLTLTVFVALFGTHTGYTQGIQAFSTQASGPLSTMDLATGNVLVSIPVRSKLGAIPFQYSLIGNSSPYKGLEGLVGKMTGASGLLEMALTYKVASIPCISPFTYTVYSHFALSDNTGASHPLPLGQIETSPYPNCPTSGQSITVSTSDGSGYSVTITPSGGFLDATVTDVSGNTASIPANAMSDPDGNKILLGVSPSGGNQYTDTLGELALSQAFANPNTPPPWNDTYSYTDKNGNTQASVVTSNPVHWKTNYGCGPARFPDFDVSSGALPVAVTQTPTGQKYTITYEPTPGFPGDVTGRIQQITLPSGGYIKYTYSGGSNGFDCSLGVVPKITKAVSDNKGHIDIWTYAYTVNSSNITVVTQTDPAGNVTVYSFAGEFQVEKQAYQGTVSSSNLLSTTITCYNGSFSNCTTREFVTPPITQSDIFTYLNSATSASLVETTYNSFGSSTAIKQYDFGATATLPPTAAPTASPLKATAITYDGNGASCGALNAGINNKPCTVTVSSPSGTASQLKYTYSATGHPTQSSVLVSGTTYLTASATYNANGTKATSTDINGAITKYFYNGTGGCNDLLLTSTSFPVNSLSTSETWDCNGGVPTSATDPNGQTTAYGYVSQGGTADPYWRVLSTKDPLGNTRWTTYSEGAPFTQETSLVFNGSASALDVLTTLDGLGRKLFLQTRQSPGSSTFDSTQYSYGWTSGQGAFTAASVPYSQTQGQAAPSGTAFTTTQSDALGRTLSAVDGRGGTVAYKYSQNDVLVTLGPAPTGENTKRRQFEYDGLGHLTSVCEVTAGTTAWPGGACAQKSAQTGYWTKYQYNALGDLLGVVQNAQSSNSHQSRSYTYDGLQRLTSENNPETGSTQYFWDAAPSGCASPSGYPTPGNLGARESNAGVYSCYGYDGLNRLLGSFNSNSQNCRGYIYDTSSSLPAGVTVVNGKGLMIAAYTNSACNGRSSLVTDEWFSYSPRSELTDVYESAPHSGGYYHSVASYWASRSLASLSGIPGVPTLYFGGTGAGLDGEGRYTEVTASAGTNPVSHIGYYTTSGATSNVGALNTITFGSGDGESFTYDPKTGRIAGYSSSVNGVDDTGTLTWNSDGSLQHLAIADNIPNTSDTQTCAYLYDDLSRLSSANCGTPWGQSFSYDAFGNISKGVLSGSNGLTFQPLYSNSTNKFMSIPAAAVQYDANGNLLTDNLNTYTWDAFNNLSTANTGSYVASMTYDALGRMVESTISGTVDEFIYGPGSQHVLAIANGQNLVKAFIPLPGGTQVAYAPPGIAYYAHSDWLGSARLASTPARTIFGNTSYAPFGESYAPTGKIAQTFTGEGQFVASSLFDFPARRYSPSQGRWISPDPLGMGAASTANPQSWNRYAYVLNNPLSLTDPSGEACLTSDNAGNLQFDQDTNGVCEQGIFVPGDPDSISVTYLPTTIGAECGCYQMNYEINGQSYYADGAPASTIIQDISVVASDPAIQMLAAEDAAGAEGAAPFILPEALPELALAGFAVDAAAETTTAAVETAGPQLLGTISLSEDLTFGTTSFGNAAHVETAGLLEKLYPEVTQNGGFTMRVLPGQTGVDVTVGEEYVDQVGFQFGEIKPMSASGEARFNQQVLNWNLPEPVQAITYDANGNVFLGFPK